MVRVDPVRLHDGIGDLDGGVRRAEPVLEHLGLVLGLLDELAEQLGTGALVGIDPRRVEHVERAVGVEGALRRVDRHERDLRDPWLLARAEHTVGVALVVVDDRLLLDGHGGRVRQRGTAAVGLEPVVQERHRDVAVVHDRRLDLLREVDDRRVREILGAQTGGLAGSGVGLGDERREARRREVGVGLAEAERAPFRMSVGRPTGRVGGQAGDVGPPHGLLGVAEGGRHRLGHSDDEWREHERRAVGRCHLGLALVGEPLVEYGTPRGRRR